MSLRDWFAIGQHVKDLLDGIVFAYRDGILTTRSRPRVTFGDRVRAFPDPA